jgi:hypothetical protein
MLTYALLGLAFAVPPDAAPAVVDWSGGVRDLAVSGDGRVVVGINGSSVAFLSVDDWSTEQAAPCNAEGAAPALTGSSTVHVYVACDSGEVRRLTWDDGVVAEDDSFVVEVSADPLVGVWWHEESDTLWAASIAADTADQVTIWSIDPASASVEGDGVPGYTGFVDAEVAGDALYVAHGGGELARLSTGGAVTYSLDVSSGVNVDDIAPSPLGSVYGVDSRGYLVEYDTSFLGWDVWKSDLAEADAVGASLVESDAWVAVAGGGEVEVWRLTDDAPSTSRYAVFDVQGTLTDIVAGGDGYAYAASDQGLVVLTANPWLEAVTATPSTGTAGTEVSLSFTVRESVDWAVYVGGDRTGSGDRIAEGTAAADDTVAVSVTVDSSWAEGRNPVYVVATDADGNEGHGAAYVTVDNPPDAVDMDNATLEFGEEQLFLSFDGVSAEDLDHYDVYVSADPFEPSDWPVGVSGGPAGPDGLDTPVRAEGSPGERIRVTLAPLENERTYYVAVRAVDAGGLEGPMSDVIEGVPHETFSASELAGDEGGPACATGAGPASALLAAVGLIAARRRRLAAVALAVGLSGTAAAHEVPEDGEDGPIRDITPSYGGFSMRYGGIALDDANIETVYGDTGNNILQLEAGPQIVRLCKPSCGGLIEFDVGAGFFQELDKTVTAEGEPSGERTMLTWFPVSVDGMLRLHVLDEQIIVPHVRYGLDYVFWREEWDVQTGGKEKVRGGKTGSHYGFGGAILLDPLGPSRASLLEAQSGINDTYLIVEWRRQDIDKPEGLDFSGRLLTVGLKLDY